MLLTDSMAALTMSWNRTATNVPNMKKATPTNRRTAAKKNKKTDWILITVSAPPRQRRHSTCVPFACVKLITDLIDPECFSAREGIRSLKAQISNMQAFLVTGQDSTTSKKTS